LSSKDKRGLALTVSRRHECALTRVRREGGIYTRGQLVPRTGPRSEACAVGRIFHEALAVSDRLVRFPRSPHQSGSVNRADAELERSRGDDFFQDDMSIRATEAERADSGAHLLLLRRPRFVPRGDAKK
jgi:hypothetical protein